MSQLKNIHFLIFLIPCFFVASASGVESNEYDPVCSGTFSRLLKNGGLRACQTPEDVARFKEIREREKLDDRADYCRSVMGDCSIEETCRGTLRQIVTAPRGQTYEDRERICRREYLECTSGSGPCNKKQR